MLLRTEDDQPQKRVMISWGLDQINFLKENNIVILRALSFEWVKQMFLMSPGQGRRLWFEVISFSTPSPMLHSPLCLFKASEMESFYRTDYYELPGIVSYSDYLTLLDSIEKDLKDAGYKCYKHVAKAEEIKVSMANGQIGGYLSRPESIENYTSLLPESDTSYSELDETPESLFTLAYKTMLEGITDDD